MKLSSNTVTILKNFAAINQGIFFKQGKVLKTVSSQKNILAEVVLDQEIPKNFGVYDLNNFLSVVTLHKDDPSFEFDDKHVVIVGNNGRSKIKYRFCEPTMIVIPPDKQLSMPTAEIQFVLDQRDFDWTMRAASILSSPQIAIESDGEKVSIVTLDLQNDSAHTDSLTLDGVDPNGVKYRMVFKTENLMKLLMGTYDVSISSKGIAHFRNKEIDLQYWVSTETGSSFQKV